MNREKLIKLIAELITSNTDKFFAIGGDTIKVTHTEDSIEVLFDDGDSDVVLIATNQVLR